MPTVVVPFRGETAKQRLAPAPEDVRAALAQAMLEDVLDGLQSRSRRRWSSPTSRAARAARSKARCDASSRADAGGQRRSAVRAAARPADAARRAARGRARARRGGRRNDQRARARRRRTCSRRSTASDSAERFLAGPSGSACPRRSRRSRTWSTTWTRSPTSSGSTAASARAQLPRSTRCAPASAVKVVVLAGGLGGSRFARALAETIDPARADDRRQRRRRRRDPRAARLARPRHDPLHAHRAARREQGLGARGRDVERARRPWPSSAARAGSGSATSTSACISFAPRRCAAASRSRP